MVVIPFLSPAEEIRSYRLATGPTRNECNVIQGKFEKPCFLANKHNGLNEIQCCNRSIVPIAACHWGRCPHVYGVQSAGNLDLKLRKSDWKSRRVECRVSRATAKKPRTEGESVRKFFRVVTFVDFCQKTDDWTNNFLGLRKGQNAVITVLKEFLGVGKTFTNEARPHSFIPNQQPLHCLPLLPSQIPSLHAQRQSSWRCTLRLAEKLRLCLDGR